MTGAIMTGHLETELQTYKDRLTELSASEGKFVLIRGSDVAGIFDTYADALSAGYERFKLAPFLVKQISSTEVLAYFTRDIDLPCRT